MTTEAMRELAEAVVERRNQIGLTQEDLASRGGPSTATIRQIESAAQASYRPRTLFALDAALNWDEGTALQLARGELTASRVRLISRSTPRDLEPPGTTEADYIAAEKELPPVELFHALRSAPTHALIYELNWRLDEGERAAEHLKQVEEQHFALIRQLEAKGGDGDADTDDSGGSAPNRTYPTIVTEAARTDTKPES